MKQKINLKASKKILIIASVLCSLVFLLFMLTYYLSIFFNSPYSDFTRDPLAVMKTHPFIGFLSNIGIILWTMAMSVSFFSSYLLKLKKRSKEALLLFVSGVITFALLIDDLFMIHDRIFPIYLQISEIPLFVFYGLLLVAYIIFFFKQLLQTSWSIFIGALTMFAISLCVDYFNFSNEFFHFFEDGPKLIGIALWFAYYTDTSLSMLAECE